MTQNELDAIIETRLKQKAAQLRYHKRTKLMAIKPSLEKMICGDLSIKEQIEILSEAGIAISDRSYREFLSREFGVAYDEFLKRNGWIRKKRRKENNE
ncbi:MAG: hypothetical protein LBN32_03405 [Helicobacteraceae bacterium]|jgi:transposase|nr:hypothetical protein [Helicobacteraceae bacterium]